jgi:regulator of replication initiation timing
MTEIVVDSTPTHTQLYNDVLQTVVQLYYRTSNVSKQMEELQRENLRLRAENRQLRIMLKKRDFSHKGMIQLLHDRDNPDASEEPVFKKPTNPVPKPVDLRTSK